MKPFKCPHCLHECDRPALRKTTNQHVGLSCPNCLRFVKWASKEEQRVWAESGVPFEAKPERMTLRDWFAGQAAASMISGQLMCDGDCHEISRRAYKLADAMLAEREVTR